MEEEDEVASNLSCTGISSLTNYLSGNSYFSSKLKILREEPKLEDAAELSFFAI